MAEAAGTTTAEGARRLAEARRSGRDVERVVGALGRIGTPTRCAWPGCSVGVYLIRIGGASWVVERRLHRDRPTGEWVVPIHSHDEESAGCEPL